MERSPAADLAEFQNELASIARLAVLPGQEDLRLYLAKLVRKYRSIRPELAERLDQSLKATSTRSGGPSILRRNDVGGEGATAVLPMDQDTGQELIRVFDDRTGIPQPLLQPDLAEQLHAIIQEREARTRLLDLGIAPTRSAIMVGPPGVGKTLSARWVACQIGKPLWVLDLAAVMSSFLGKTGNNLRAALEHAKANEAVLLLDEFDAIAKRRGDESDIGELKRLVTVMLQEIDRWPDSSLLLAATNHPELVDPALWRRFDTVLQFEPPTEAATEAAVYRFLGPDLEGFRTWVPTLCSALAGRSLSDVERAINALRRGHALESASIEEMVWSLVGRGQASLPRAARLKVALEMVQQGAHSYSEISQVTGVARDTLRKHAGPSPRKGRGLK